VSRWRHVAKLVGLGLVAGAVLQNEAAAQDTVRVRRDTARVRRDTTVRVPIPPQADTIVKRDSIAQRDSAVRARLARLAADSVKTPLARAEMPVLVDVARPEMRWDRASLFATGALTLLDLLERVPGLSGYRAGWLAAPMIGAYLGDMRRIRVFYDGVEQDPLDPRMNGAIDLGSIQLWPAEEVRVERGADELRVHVRTWRAERTTPYTRADVGTGDQETNLYRGFFGRRFDRGEALQVSAQQLSTRPARLGESSNHSAVHVRLGWANKWWHVDATLLRSTPDRGSIRAAARSGVTDVDSVVSAAATETNAYLRVAYGDPESGPWAQLVAGAHEYKFGGQPEETDAPDQPVPDADTTRYQAQYVLAGGLTWRGIRFSATDRVRFLEGDQSHAPMVRGSLSSPFLSASLLAEQRHSESDPRAEAMIRLSPVRFVALGGAVATEFSGGAGADALSARAEAAVRVGELWLGGGVIRRPGRSLAAPTIYSRRFTSAADGDATGAFATIRGRLWGAIFADLTGIQWQDDNGFLRPRYQSRSEIYVSTTLPRRFPSGNFGLLASLLHEYRSHTLFPTATLTDRAGGYRLFSGLLEIRILDAVLTYQYRNLLVEDFETLPGYAMPRQTQFYGVRWNFWN
jgi:hypothetical protein